MPVRIACCLLALLFTLTSLKAQKPAADAILGNWQTRDNKASVQVYKKGGQYFGRIISLKEPLTNGRAKTDSKNPDTNLRQQPIIGLEILKGFRFDGDDEWEDGTIYDPESGKEYSCKITLSSKGELKVRGYVGVSLLGRTEVWRRN